MEKQYPKYIYEMYTKMYTALQLDTADREESALTNELLMYVNSLRCNVIH